MGVGIVKKTIADLAARRKLLSEQKREAMAAVSDETIERLAAEDEDCPELSDEQLERAQASRAARKARALSSDAP